MSMSNDEKCNSPFDYASTSLFAVIDSILRGDNVTPRRSRSSAVGSQVSQISIFSSIVDAFRKAPGKTITYTWRSQRARQEVYTSVVIRILIDQREPDLNFNERNVEKQGSSS